MSESIGLVDDDRGQIQTPALSAARFMTDLTTRHNAVSRLRAADQALYAAECGGRPQARGPDLANLDMPQVANASYRSAG
jgi:hypothetical protein